MRSAEEGLRRCLTLDPSAARPYVVLGKLLMLQKRYDEARTLYQEGCRNTGALEVDLIAALPPRLDTGRCHSHARTRGRLQSRAVSR